MFLYSIIPITIKVVFMFRYGIQGIQGIHNNTLHTTHATYYSEQISHNMRQPVHHHAGLSFSFIEMEEGERAIVPKCVVETTRSKD